MNDKVATPLKNIRSHKRVLKIYLFLIAAPVFLYQTLATKDYWTLLFISCLALYAPILWCAFIIFIGVKSFMFLDRYAKNKKENIQDNIVQSLQMNRLEDLSRAIEANPEILYSDYQRRSLIAWCRYYKNTRAQELIIHLMQKYPKESLAA